MKRFVILVGHGGVPTDCPPTLVAEFKKAEAKAAAQHGPTPELAAADKKLRSWPRTPQTDPYKWGLEAIAASLAQKGFTVLPAYNEFCAPSLEDAFEDAVRQGAADISIITTMFTRGGIHSEREIPALVNTLKSKHPGVTVNYRWPFDLNLVASFLAQALS